MSVVDAEPLSLDLERVLDDRALSRVAQPAPHLNGGLRRSGGTAPEALWMEPPAGSRPRARTRVHASVEGSWGGSRLTAPAEVFHLDVGEVLRITYYTLTLAVARDGSFEVLRWWLEPGGDDATRRANGLDFLAALHRGGVLSLLQADDMRELAKIPLPEQPFDEELEDARVFLNQVAALEEWSGVQIPVPAEVDADQATEVARAVAVIMARQVPLSLGDEITVTVRNAGDSLQMDELRVPWVFTETILGTRVPMGTADVTVGVIPSRGEPVDDGLIRIHCQLDPAQPRAIQAHLYPPESRSRVVRRTLVGAAPVPPRPDGFMRQVDALRLEQLGALLNEWEGQEGEIEAELQERVRREWDA